MRELDIENDGGTVSLKGIGCMNIRIIPCQRGSYSCAYCSCK